VISGEWLAMPEALSISKQPPALSDRSRTTGRSMLTAFGEVHIRISDVERAE
jgi:hypothetical protein